jgi:hypothetical protein
MSPPVPLVASVVWVVDGEEHIDTVALGWTGPAVSILSRQSRAYSAALVVSDCWRNGGRRGWLTNGARRVSPPSRKRADLQVHPIDSASTRLIQSFMRASCSGCSSIYSP